LTLKSTSPCSVIFLSSLQLESISILLCLRNCPIGLSQGTMRINSKTTPIGLAAKWARWAKSWGFYMTSWETLRSDSSSQKPRSSSKSTKRHKPCKTSSTNPSDLKTRRTDL
jgi:hypothetical protein